MRVLVTGASGRIGQVVVAELLERGYAVRATTSKPSTTLSGGSGLEWVTIDLFEAAELDRLVEGCDAVLHIAAEMHTPEKMWRTNAEATDLLAAAAERAGVKAFAYTSSVAVYGSGLARLTSEDAPVLTVSHDVKTEYWGNDAIRAYGRSKLGGEIALRSVAKRVRYIIFRPAVVVSIGELISIREWSGFKRSIAAHRHAHHVYVNDVADALIWAIEQAIAGTGEAGSVCVFNLAEDDVADPKHIDFLRKAYAASSDRRFRVVKAPGIVDWLRDFLRFRRLPLRNPLWRMRFSNERLLQAGYRFRYGMSWAQNLALQRLRSERER